MVDCWYIMDVATSYLLAGDKKKGMEYCRKAYEKLIESVEPHQNDKTYSKYIINPEENYDLASKITPIINKHQNIIPMKRDHCLEINRDLLFDLENAGYKFELVSGYFICDNVNITDLQDLKTLKKYNEY